MPSLRHDYPYLLTRCMRRVLHDIVPGFGNGRRLRSRQRPRFILYSDRRVRSMRFAVGQWNKVCELYRPCGDWSELCCTYRVVNTRHDTINLGLGYGSDVHDYRFGRRLWAVWSVATFRGNGHLLGITVCQHVSDQFVNPSNYFAL